MSGLDFWNVYKIGDNSVMCGNISEVIWRPNATWEPLLQICVSAKSKRRLGLYWRPGLQPTPNTTPFSTFGPEARRNSASVVALRKNLAFRCAVVSPLSNFNNFRHLGKIWFGVYMYGTRKNPIEWTTLSNIRFESPTSRVSYMQ